MSYRNQNHRWRRNSLAKIVLGLIALVGCIHLPTLAFGQSPSPANPNPAAPAAKQEATEQAPSEEADRDAAFRQRLENSVWTGRFTVLGRDDLPLVEERYEIRSVEKMDQDDFWKIEARVKYGDRDFTMPFAVQVKWAGNTPVITVDKLFIPGMGTFDARVLIRNDQYAGTWAHDDVRGHMFGTFRQAEKSEDRRP